MAYTQAADYPVDKQQYRSASLIRPASKRRAPYRQHGQQADDHEQNPFCRAEKASTSMKFSAASVAYRVAVQTSLLPALDIRPIRFLYALFQQVVHVRVWQSVATNTAATNRGSVIEFDDDPEREMIAAPELIQKQNDLL